MSSGAIRTSRFYAGLPISTAFVSNKDRLLDGLWQTLAENGLLLYVTCSIMPAENERQIEQFLARQSDARIQTISAEWEIQLPLGRQLLPGDQDADGFYFAMLTKQREN
ncbi:MAG: hypothetical protein ACFHHU_05620 [Porticoccaceae bacterium]